MDVRIIFLEVCPDPEQTCTCKMSRKTTAANIIMQTFPCDVDPLTPHFYIVKLGFIGVFILTEAVLTCTHDLCFEQKYEKSKNKTPMIIVIFRAVKNRCMLHGRVFVIWLKSLCKGYNVGWV